MGGWTSEGDWVGFDIGFTSITQTTYGSPMCKVLIQFQILGPRYVDDTDGNPTFIDCVQIYAVNVVDVGSGLQDLVDTVDLQIPYYEYSCVADLQAGAEYRIYLCPRSATETADGKIGDIYWEKLCVFYGFVTQIDLPPTSHPRPPVITGWTHKPATVQGDASITVAWRSDPEADYQSYCIDWTDGYWRPYGEVDYQSPTATGSWTLTPVVPGVHYTFAVKGGVYGGTHYNYYDWGPKVSIVAPSNLTSLRQFLSISGINPAGVNLRSLMSPQTSLRKFMKLA